MAALSGMLLSLLSRYEKACRVVGVPLRTLAAEPRLYVALLGLTVTTSVGKGD